MARYIVGMTGASGSIYGTRLAEEILRYGHEVYLVMTDNGKKVFAYELEMEFEEWTKKVNKKRQRLILCNIDDMFSPIASGSFRTDGMIIVPCSMGTLAKVSNGITDNLLTRAADVMMKEKRKLVVVPRETPFHSIHLKNMLALSDLNVTILPAIPCFYGKPKTLDDIVHHSAGRMLISLGIENNLYYRWKGPRA